MVEVNLASALAMGLVLLAIVVAASRARDWHAAPASVGGGRAVGDALERPATWSAAFVAVAVAAVLVVVAFVGGSIPGITDQFAGFLLGTLLGLAFALFLAAGVYVTARNRGFPQSTAAAAGAITLGSLLLAAIAFQLLFGG